MILLELQRLTNLITGARTASDVLGPDDEGRKARHREVIRLLHPDLWNTMPNAQTVATEAFARLQQLISEETSPSTFEITTKNRTFKISGLAFRGTVSNLYDCRYPREGEMKDGLLKLPRSPRDNDLVTAEGQALKKIWDSGEVRRVFFPRFEEMFKHRDRTTRVDRTGLVVRRLPKFISLADVLKAIPQGLDARDLAWIWRRALAALSLSNELGLVHGALVPEHLLIQPEEHGVILCGWSATVNNGEVIKTLGGDRKFFAPEVLAKQPATIATDIYMLHATMLSALREDEPRQFHAFIKGCMFERPAVRPQDPWALLGEFDSLLVRLYGPKKFKVFPSLPQT